LITLAVIVITALVTAVFSDFKNSWPPPTAAINTTVHLPRINTVTCKQLDDQYAKIHLYVEGMDTGLTAVGCTDATAKDPTVRDATTKDAAPKDAAAKDATVKDATARDATVKDATAKDAIAKDETEKAATAKDASKKLTTPTIAFPLRHIRTPGRTPALSPEADQAVWDQILGRPLESLTAGRRLPYTIRWENPTTPLLNLNDSAMQLHLFKWWAPVAVMGVIYVWVLLGYFAAKSALLRDRAPPGTPLDQMTFSLAKTQMAWWFALILASFVFLWLVTGETPSVSAQALSFLGIASATAIASANITPDPKQATRGTFIYDLLNDGAGIAIQRFQMVVMTAVLGLMFLFEVMTRLIMPEFDASLLTIMGISAGTYVALKV
jgi:hypothetical protein